MLGGRDPDLLLARALDNDSVRTLTDDLGRTGFGLVIGGVELDVYPTECTI